MKIRVVPTFALALLFLFAATGYAERESPAAFIQGEVTKVLLIVDDDSLDPETRRQALSDLIATRFDFEDMSRSILAVSWRKATPEQRVRFQQLFKDVLEDTYISAIEKRTDETVLVGGERIRDGRATVIVTIERTGGGDIPLLFKLKPYRDSWIAYDVNIEGLSLVSHYRTELGAIAQKEGVEGVIRYLEAKTAS